METGGEGEVAERGQGGERAQHGTGAGRIDRAVPGLGESARRLTERHLHDDGDENAGNADDVERGTPPVLVRDVARRDEADELAEVDAERVDRLRGRAALRLEVVADDRIRGRVATRFADADAHAGQEDVPEIHRTARERGGHAPDEEREADDVHAAVPVGPAGDRQPQRHVEDRKGDA
jgi:hypothetical protein